MTTLLDRDLGRIHLPAVSAGRSYAGAPTRRGLRECGIVVAKQRRPRYRDDGLLDGYELIWASVSHNERVDAGAQQQAKQVFGGGGSPAAPSATLYPKVIAVASASLTKAKTDQSLGVITSGVTTNEFTTIGLTRIAATSPVGGDYTAPSAIGTQFTQLLAKTFTASGSGTAYGSGVFDSTTPSGSILYVEDNFSSNAVLVSGDTLAVTWTIQN